MSVVIYDVTHDCSGSNHRYSARACLKALHAISDLNITMNRTSNGGNIISITVVAGRLIYMYKETAFQHTNSNMNSYLQKCAGSSSIIKRTGTAQARNLYHAFFPDPSSLICAAANRKTQPSVHNQCVKNRNAVINYS